jgi:predicted metal-dependent peptidase
MDNKSTNALSEVLQWACSPRGGNNFYGRILNGCGRVNIPGLHTAGVTITPEGRYLLACDNEWFAEQPRPFQIVVMIHEAGHLALMHIERELRYKRIIIDKKKFRYIHKILNVAMDMAVNDVAVRPFLSEQGSKFEACREKLIFPEDREYPPDLEFETYFSMLMKDLKEHGFDPNNHELHVQMGGGSGQGDAEEDDQQQGGSGSQGEDGEDEQEQEGGGGGSEGEKEQQEAQGPGKGDGYDPQQDPNLPGWFKGLLQKQLTVHVDWTDAFEDMTDAEVERATDRATREGKKIMLAAAQQTEKSRGTLPAGMEAIINGLLEEPTIPWEIVFRGMLKSALSSKLQESTTQPNPMLFHLEDDGVEPYPGFQNDFTFHIDATFDTSGSVSDEEFKKFMGELMGIMRTEKGVSVRMIMYDAAIQHEEMLDPQDELSDRNAYDRYGYGGTDFTPALKLILGKDTEEDWVKNAERITNERVPKADLVVMFTDGYAPVDVSEGGPIPDYEPPCPLIWALTSSGKSHPAMGNRVLWITE